MVERELFAAIRKALKPNKVILLYGARRVGKTFLLKQIVSKYDGKSLLLNGEDYNVQKMLEEQSANNYKRLFKNVDLLVIDEAQSIPDIGMKLKLMVDEIAGIKIIASGSSSFNLNNKAGEPLVGRKRQFLLPTFSERELSKNKSGFEIRESLESRLIYGSYPEVVTMEDTQDREDYLREIVDSYLLKDILAFDGIKNSSKMKQLLQMIAFQLGNEVSYDELGTALSLSKNTVEKYLDLLSKTFVLFRLGAYSKNLRKEVSKSGKWFFCDVGIRNALISDFKPLALRNDIGHLWENFFISEKIKNAENSQTAAEFFFWRTYDKQKIDLLELRKESLSAYEVKWGNKKAVLPGVFAKAYPQADFQLVNRENYQDLLLVP